MGISINKWQRIVFVFGALASGIYSFIAAVDEYGSGRPGLPFIVAVILATLSLSSPPQGEATWPTFPMVSRRIFRKAAIFGMIAVVCGVILLLLVQMSSRQQAKVYEGYEVTAPAAETEASAAEAQVEITEDTPVVTYNPSFDCNRHLNNTERMICQDETLSENDRKLSEMYGDLLKAYKGAYREELINRQRLLLAERATCPDLSCISKWYDEQLANIEYLLADTPNTEGAE